MSNFQNNRATAVQIREQYQQLSGDQYRLQQDISLLDTRLEEGNTAQEPVLLEQREQLLAKLKKTEEELKLTKQKLTTALETLYLDAAPAQLVSALDDQLPVLLLPLKVETRFITIKSIGQDLPPAALLDVSQIQPDLGPYFEQLLSAGNSRIPLPTLPELKAKGFNDAAAAIERDIKRGVLAPGNGEWVRRQADRKELWVRIFPDDIFLHNHEAALLEAEYLAGKNYWLEVWAAEREFRQNETEDKEAQRTTRIREAWNELQYAFTVPRAKWILTATQPANYQDGQSDFSQEPQFQAVHKKTAGWTLPSQSFVLPDRFVVRLYQAGQLREYTGALIPEDLPLGLDPFSDTFPEGEEADLELPERLRWISDFEEAEKMGMALRIPLNEAEYTAGFEKVVVLGLRLSADEDQSKALTEELFYNHQYKSGGLSFLAQGTPTNQTAAVDMAKEQLDLENAAFLEWSGAAANTAPGPGTSTDGKRLSTALGVDPKVFQKVVGDTGREMDEAAAMNQLLWPATMGYFLQQFLFPLVNSEDRARTRAFFTDFVAGRGQLPVCRIDDQPYGILPATPFSRWTYPEGSADHDFPDRLWRRVLRVLDGQWEQLTLGVPHVGDGFTAGKKYSDRLLQLLGLHAGSVEFFVRTLVDPFFSEDVLQVTPDSQLDDHFWEVKKELEGMDFYFESFETASRMFDMVFSWEVKPLDGPLIDHLPLSEQRKVQNMPGSEEHYLAWLFNSDLTTAMRNESHSMEDAAGLPVLYLLLRHAIVREYMNVAIALLEDAGLLSPVAGVDQEREEQGMGAGHKYYLRTAIQMRRQHQVRRQVETTYQELVAGGLTSQRITEFEQAVGHAFPFYDASNFLRRTVDKAVQKLRGRLIPQPDAPAIRQAISDFVVDVEEAIQVQVDADLEQLSGEVLIEPDKWKLLTESYPQVSGAQTMLAFIDAQLGMPEPPPVFNDLLAMKEALAMIRDLPTAKLERLLVEHLDLCNYRLDAWMLGLAHQRLAELRAQRDGLYLGAYGYLEDLRPGAIPGYWVETGALSFTEAGTQMPNFNEVSIPLFHFGLLQQHGMSVETLLTKAYLYLGEDPSISLAPDLHSNRIIAQPPLDLQGEGFIHAPSLAHANAAAILRSGYATYRQPGTDPAITDPFAVNLTSQRVRKALHHLEGIRNNQSLGALLGYQFERALYEYADQEPVNVDFVSRVPGYILALRQHFPLNTQQQTSSPDAAGVFNVINGLALLEAYQAQSGFGHWSANILTDLPAAHRDLLDLEIAKLEDHLDGLSDLLLAESIYQMAKGNPERSAAALKVLNEGSMMDHPEVIETPRNGFSFMHRLAIVSNSQTQLTGWPDAPSPLSLVQPAVNHWVARQLPAPEDCGGGAILPNGEVFSWTPAQLGMQPIDLIDAFTRSDPGQAGSAFSIRALDFVREQSGLDTDQVILLALDKTDRLYSIADLVPLLQSIGELLQAARPMRSEDLFQPSQRQQGQTAASLDLTIARAGFGSLLKGNGPYALPGLITALEELAKRDDPAATDDCYELLKRIADFGISEAIPQAGRQATTENLLVLKLQSQHLLAILKKKQANAHRLWDAAQAASTPGEELENLTELGQELFGRSFKLYPAFRFTDPDLIISRTPLPDVDDLEVAEWLQGAELVRPRLAAYQRLSMLREAYAVSSRDQRPELYQLPEVAAPWVGRQLPPENLHNGDTLSLALESPEDLRLQDAIWGMVIDEWSELIPHPTTTTGITFNYDQPDAEAPQVMLLAVCPELRGHWTWDDLMNTVTESMQLAKKRAVEPDQLKQTPLAHFLPAVLGPINEEQLYPSVDFTKNIAVNSKQ